MIEMLKKGRIALCRLLEVTLILAVTALVLVVLWGVLTRYAFGKQADWSEELARFLLIWISLLGGAVAFGEKAHLGVDYFVGKFDPAARKFTAVLGQLIILFFAITIFMIGGSNIVMNNMEQVAPALGTYGIKMGHVYLALPIAGVFMILFTTEQLLETLFIAESNEEDN
jgi:TRAP-type C4-dicarboxylate transport system permease small subunit